MAVTDCTTDLDRFADELIAVFEKLKYISSDDASQWLAKNLKVQPLNQPLWALNSHNCAMILTVINRLVSKTSELSQMLAFERITEELDEWCKPGRAGEPVRIEAKLLSELLYFSQEIPHDIMSSLVNIQASHRPTGGDVAKLHRAYSSNNPPDIRYLQADYVMDALVNDTFSYNRSAPHHEERIWLLAYASSANRGPKASQKLVRL